MNVLVIGEAGTWFDRHVTATLREMGHHVSVFHYGGGVGEYYPRARRSERAQKNRRLLEQAYALRAERGLDLIFCYVYDDFLLPDAAAALAGLGAPMVNYNVDMTNQWYRQIRIARYFTYMLCAQRVHMNDLGRYGAPTYYFPMAARTPIATDADGDAAAPVTFVGTPTDYRIAVLAKLAAAGIPLAIYGKFWKEQLVASAERNLEKTLDDILAYGVARLRGEGISAVLAALAWRFARNHCGGGTQSIKPALRGTLDEAAIAAVFRCSKINIGTTRIIGSNPARRGATQMKLRDFEVPVCGGFYLVEHAPDYDEMFTPGREVETWRTVGELVEKVRYYLAHAGERSTIAAAGRHRALAEHLWTHRFSALFNRLGIG